MYRQVISIHEMLINVRFSFIRPQAAVGGDNAVSFATGRL
jgi:hypothetical protein